LFTLIGFLGLGVIIFKSFIQKPQPQLFYLNVDSMQMAAGPVTDSTGKGLEVVSIFPCNVKNAGGEVIPWADLYVCRSHNRRDSLSGGTALVFIDIHTESDLKALKNINHYGTDIKIAQKFRKCRVRVPAGQIDNIRKYRYRFARVTLIDDWLYD